ncbi:MAG: YCF48-related protein [Betaproteobacteria bacterium]
MTRPFVFAAALATAIAAIAGACYSAGADAQINPLVMPSTGPLSKQAMARLLLTDSARFGNRIVAVGDRGYIVLSDSNGENWERAETPPNLPLLNAVFFSDQKTGWAVGHDAVILKSTDEGKKWTQVFSAPAEQKPLMDILFIDANIGFAVGAYGSFYETGDAGKTWTSRKLLETPKASPRPPPRKGKAAAVEPEENEKGGDKASEEDRHFNAIVKLAGNRLLIAGEAGILLKSEDAGKTWAKIASPYKGSYFGAIQAQDGSVLIYGLRGKIYRSSDAAMKDWKLVENKSVATVMGSTRLPDGTLVLAGLAGTVLVSRDNGANFSPLPTGLTKGYAAPLLGAPNALMLVGEAGARDVLLSSATK